MSWFLPSSCCADPAFTSPTTPYRHHPNPTPMVQLMLEPPPLPVETFPAHYFIFVDTTIIEPVMTKRTLSFHVNNLSVENFPTFPLQCPCLLSPIPRGSFEQNLEVLQKELPIPHILLIF
mmetsp:Transcript_24084/g.28366  ORF Transcript_24084/g.28366 Transcript_24084/m.28366 type:complete len:120 (-) Transcript_24084:820-1179(-)